MSSTYRKGLDAGEIGLGISLASRNWRKSDTEVKITKDFEWDLVGRSPKQESLSSQPKSPETARPEGAAHLFG